MSKFGFIFFIGDTKGNNKWLGQYPGNREGVRRPYHDYKCQFHNLSNPNPNSTYLTMDYMNFAKKGNKKMKTLELNITAQFPCMTLEMHLLNRVFHYLTIFMDCTKMMPPELLHTSGSGLIMYMFESLRDQMGGGKFRDLINKQHIQISNFIKRQSEHDFPRGSMRNGLIDGTKCQSSE
jgi:hypothetical protein